jgi:hypothetical protein
MRNLNQLTLPELLELLHTFLTILEDANETPAEAADAWELLGEIEIRRLQEGHKLTMVGAA